MGNRVFHVVVILLWLATMSWLIVSKVLPPLIVGEPPTYRTTLPELEQIVCWRLEWDGQPLGWAATKAVPATRMLPASEGVTEVHSRVVLRQLPLQKLAPVWLGAFVRPLLRQVGKVDMDARSRLEIDPLGRLSGFKSSVRVADMPGAITMSGRIEQSQLHVRVRSGDFSYETQRYVPADALVANELSPQAMLPGLKLGQTWTMPVYSVLRPPGSPLEILQAEVEDETVLQWGGKSEKAWLVVYRSDSGTLGRGKAAAPRGRLWVARDGRVLQQEVTVFNSRMRFVRLTRAEGREYARQLDTNWLADLHTGDVSERDDHPSGVAAEREGAGPAPP